MAWLLSSLTGRMSEAQRIAATTQAAAKSETELAKIDRKLLIFKDELDTLKLEAKAYKRKGKEPPADLAARIKNKHQAIVDLQKSRSTIEGASGVLARVDTQITTTESIKETTALANKLAKQNKKQNTEAIVEQFHDTQEILDDTGGLFDEIADYSRAGAADIDEILGASDSDLSEEEEVPVAAPARRSGVPVSRAPPVPAPTRRPPPRSREDPLAL